MNGFRERPTFDVAGQVYRLTWPTLQLEATVDHMHDAHDLVSGEITFRLAGRENGQGHLKRARLNFTSDSAQGKLASTMAKQYPDMPAVEGARQPVDWDAIIEQISVKSLDAYRVGDPLVCMESVEFKPLSFLIRPLLPLNQVTAIYGPPGGTKSTVAALLALKVAWGLAGPGFDGSLTVSHPGPVLWLDYETDESTFKWLLSRLRAGLQAEDRKLDTIFYQPLDRPLVSCLDQVLERINRVKPVLVVLDSVLRAIGSVNANETGPGTGLANAIRSFKTTTLEIGHDQKGDGDSSGAKSLLGSQTFTASIRWSWQALVAESSDEDVSHLALMHGKHNLSRKLPPIGLCFEYDGDDGPISVAREDIADVPEHASKLPASIQIKAVLQHGYRAFSQIEEETGLPKGTVAGTLKRLKEKGVVANFSGLWGLIGPQEE